MAVSVVVPWRPSDAYRQRAWDFTRARYAAEHPTWQVIEGRHDDGPWIKALAVQEGLSRADGDVLVIADADCWTDLTPAVEALAEFGWAIPHRNVHRLTVAATDALLRGYEIGTTEEQPYKGYVGGGFVVLSRSLYDEVPLDPRFEGWGHEDEAWGVALTTLAGRPWRGHVPLTHLWHPPQDRLCRQVGSPDNEALYLRYRHAYKRPDLMAQLIEEAKCRSNPSWSTPSP